MCLLIHRVKPWVVISKLNTADLPPPKDLTDEIRDAENETILMPTAKLVDRIASTPGGDFMHTYITYVWYVANSLNDH